MGRTKYTMASTGALGVEKALFIEEELLKKLKKLSETTEIRFEESLKKSSKIRPVSKLEKEEILRTITFLEELKQNVPSLEKINNISDKEKLQKVENILRNITLLSRKYHDTEKGFTVIKRLGEEEISELLRTLYLAPEHHSQESSLLFYSVTHSQLRALEEESRKINECNDPDFYIKWRRWWRDMQVFEKDKTTPLKDPHINVTIKLFGGPKKDIHLLLAA
ncbi:hypothetical protein HZA99_03075 [Candidatus Woesearchaeota archaeon]|nr:hypothetical protein [Candidatus Woesearchaeota archaeon]